MKKYKKISLKTVVFLSSTEMKNLNGGIHNPSEEISGCILSCNGGSSIRSMDIPNCNVCMVSGGLMVCMKSIDEPLAIYTCSGSI